MINLKEHIKLTVLYTFFGAFPAVLQLIVYPVIEGVDRLGAEDFGYLAITEAIISFAFIICLFGMTVAIARFYYDFTEDKEGYSKLVSTIFTSISARAFVLMGIVLIISPFIGKVFNQIPLQNFISYGPSLIIIAFNRAIISVSLSLYRNEKRIKNFIYISFFSGLLRTVFQLIGIFVFDMSFLGYIYGTAIGGSIISITIILYIWIQNGIRLTPDIYKHLRKFTYSLVFNDLIFWGIFFIDRFFLLKNAAQLGIYDNAMKFAFGIQFIVQGLASAIQPEIFRYLKDGIKNKEKEIKTLSHLYISETIALVALSIIPIVLFINFFYETDLKLSAGIVGLVLMRYILNAVYQVTAWPIIYFKHTSIFYKINSFVLIILLLINIWLVPIIGYYGSIAAFLFAGLLQVILLYRSQQKVCFISWNKYKVLYFPIGIIIISAVLEFFEQCFRINLYIIDLTFVFAVFTGLVFIYRNELFGLAKRYLSHQNKG